jgi:hypothetical protein
MTAAISGDPSPDVVLQALLAHDLMAFTEFALRMSLISSARRFSKNAATSRLFVRTRTPSRRTTLAEIGVDYS